MDKPKTIEGAASALRKNKKGWQPGHERFAGRQPGSPPKKKYARVIEMLEELEWHPAVWLATVARDGVIVNPDKSLTPVPLEERTRAAVALLPFCAPRLAQTQAHITDDRPQNAQANSDWLMRVMRDPKLLEAAQTLGISMAERPAGLPAPQLPLAPGQPVPRVIDADPEHSE